MKKIKLDNFELKILNATSTIISDNTININSINSIFFNTFIMILLLPFL